MLQVMKILQFKVSDVEINTENHNHSKELSKINIYEKILVPFTSMQDLKDCLYLGGKIS